MYDIRLVPVDESASRFTQEVLFAAGRMNKCAWPETWMRQYIPRYAVLAEKYDTYIPELLAELGKYL